MKNDIMKGVEDTLFIPLVARIEISKKFPDLFCDHKSLSIEDKLSAHKILERSSEYSMMASVSRYYVMDNIVQDLIEKNNIVQDCI